MSDGDTKAYIRFQSPEEEMWLRNKNGRDNKKDPDEFQSPEEEMWLRNNSGWRKKFLMRGLFQSPEEEMWLRNALRRTESTR